MPGTTKSAHTGIKACMGAWAHFNIENVGGCRVAWASQRSRRAINYAFIVVSDRISGPSCIFPSYTWAPFQSKWGRAKTAVASNRAAAVSSIESCHFLLCHRRILETVLTMNKHFASCYSECTPDNRIHRCLHSHLQKQNQHYEVYGNFSGP